mgnify:CR=1 FL=1
MILIIGRIEFGLFLRISYWVFCQKKGGDHKSHGWITNHPFYQVFISP